MNGPVTAARQANRDTSFAMVIAMVKARLREAAATLKRMHLERWDYPSQRTAWWPDVVRSALDSYPDEKTKTTRAAPDGAAIDRMEEVLRWLLWMEDDDHRKLVWARAERITWRQLETNDGRSRETLRKLYDKALAVIVGKLARERKR